MSKQILFKALIGIAFSVGFIIGPVIGAVFAKWSQGQHGDWFVIPATFAFLLSLADLLFVIFYFKESLPKVNINFFKEMLLFLFGGNNELLQLPSDSQGKRAKSVAKSIGQATAYINFNDIFKFRAVKNINQKDLVTLQTLGVIYFSYLLVYR